MYRHIKNAYDFNLSKEPHEEWWWHLDKVANGDIKIGFTSVDNNKVV
jgi:hypothetical protein